MRRAFLIAVPLLLAAITAIMPSQKGQKLSWWTTSSVTLVLLIAAVALAQFEVSEGLPVYPMGGWEPPYGISLVIDALSAPVLVLIAAMALFTMVYAMPATAVEIEPKKGSVPNILTGEIKELIYLGDHIRTRMEIAGNDEFIVKVPNNAGHVPLAEGAKVNGGWEARDCKSLDLL